MIFIRMGDSRLIASIWGWNIKNITSAESAEIENRVRFRYLKPPDCDSPYSQLYIFENLKKMIKDRVKKSFG